jgi:hypothetical protein
MLGERARPTARLAGQPARNSSTPEPCLVSLGVPSTAAPPGGPHALSPLSTHDTKRSEDVRARINVLSEMPREWGEAVARWRKLNEPHRRTVEDLVAPDANEEYLLYQTLVGAWPLEPYTEAAPFRHEGRGHPQGLWPRRTVIPTDRFGRSSAWPARSRSPLLPGRLSPPT